MISVRKKEQCDVKIKLKTPTSNTWPWRISVMWTAARVLHSQTQAGQNTP